MYTANRTPRTANLLLSLLVGTLAGCVMAKTKADLTPAVLVLLLLIAVVLASRGLGNPGDAEKARRAEQRRRFEEALGKVPEDSFLHPNHIFDSTGEPTSSRAKPGAIG